jgi:hypothetical protein
MIEFSIRVGQYGWGSGYIDASSIESIKPVFDARHGEPQSIIRTKSGDEIRVREYVSDIHKQMHVEVPCPPM